MGEKFYNKRSDHRGSFIGSNLARRPVKTGQSLLVDSPIPEYGNLFNIRHKKVEANIADVRDVYSMRYLVQGKDYLFNLAGKHL
jgi:UDP-glucose 4-epimerase